MHKNRLKYTKRCLFLRKILQKYVNVKRKNRLFYINCSENANMKKNIQLIYSALSFLVVRTEIGV